MENQLKLQEHFFRQSGFTVAGYVDGNPFLSPVQEYRCEKCNEIISLPDCYHANGKKKNFCLTLMSLGCQGGAVKAPLPPRKEKVWEEKRDYPAKKKRS
jgi:hypothetical protein